MIFHGLLVAFMSRRMSSSASIHEATTGGPGGVDSGFFVTAGFALAAGGVAVDEEEEPLLCDRKVQ